MAASLATSIKDGPEPGKIVQPADRASSPITPTTVPRIRAASGFADGNRLVELFKKSEMLEVPPPSGWKYSQEDFLNSL
jgi:hypothetical protein